MNDSQGFHRTKTQKELEKKNLELENFKDRVMFMSMFSDIEWKKDDENCISNVEKVKNFAKRFLPGHWISESRVGKDGTATLTVDNGTAKPTKWCSNSEKLVILYLKLPMFDVNTYAQFKHM